ncbi:MAG: hypothetical protein ACOYL3_16285 [Desulfuromonadaceae bacterium]
MPKTKEPRAHDEVAEASKEIYALAQADSETKLTVMREEIEALKQESFGMGALHAIEANIAYNEFLKAVTLLRIKKEKDYRKGGMTWDAFCEARGLVSRTVDRMLEDFAPVFNSFSANLSDFTGMPFSKIRMLGKHISDNLSEIKDNCLIYGDESIPLTPEYRDDIQALIERIGEEAKEKIEDLEATVSAKEKVLKSKGDVITKMERALKKYEKEAAVMGITPEEDAYIQQINGLKMGFDGYLLRLEKNIVPEDYDTFTPRMKAALISAAHYMQMQILALYENITTEHGNPTMNPELLAGFDAWEKEQQT